MSSCLTNLSCHSNQNVIMPDKPISCGLTEVLACFLYTCILNIQSWYYCLGWKAATYIISVLKSDVIKIVFKEHVLFFDRQYNNKQLSDIRMLVHCLLIYVEWQACPYTVIQLWMILSLSLYLSLSHSLTSISTPNPTWAPLSLSIC